MDGIILILRDDSETKKGQIVYKYGRQLLTEKERTDVGDPDNEKGKERRKMFLSKKKSRLYPTSVVNFRSTNLSMRIHISLS